MRENSPRWEQINPSAFTHEQDGLRILGSYLPDTDPYHVWANVEFVGTDGSINEVDALVLVPSGLYVLELKHWQGELSGGGTQWVRRTPNGRLMPEDNPYILANRKAKRLAGLIRHYARQQGKADQIPYVGAAVFLHAVALQAGLDEIGRQHVYGLDQHPSGLDSLKDLLLARPRNPDHLVDPDRGRQIVELVRGAKIRPSVADRKVGQLLLYPKPFAEGIGWQDFLAGHALDTQLVRRVRFYLTSRAADDEVPVIRRGAEREFRLLQGIHHPGIARATDLVDHPLGPAVVFDHDNASIRFDQWLTEHNGRLRLAQRLRLVQDLAEIIDYAHSRRLAHRALHPRAVFVSDPAGPGRSLVVTDWQTGGRLAGATQLTRLSSSTDGAGLELFFDDEVRRYQAPEAAISSAVPGSQLDVFSLGAIAYRIFADAESAATAEDLVAAVHDGGLDLSAAADGMPESLVQLVYDATRGDPAQRLRDVTAFRAGLERVWEAMTAPEPEPVIDPLGAHKGDVLDGDLTVVRRLGTGATALALLVTERTPDGPRELVLKVARDEQHAERLGTEAETLDKLKHWQVASLVKGPVNVGGRTALLMESAGARTLAQELEGNRRLALDLLERYGRDLLDIVVFLEGQGIWHRDIKPANLAARPRPKDKQPHLCIFDFSLAGSAADQIRAGTPPYLDPFLGPPRRMRYDAAAERFAAAVTLYEMATGTLPRWGDNANPAAITDEVSLDPASFDPAVADRLAAFFAKALARDAARRFDTAEDMSDAWRVIFKEIPKSAPGPVPLGPRATALTPESLLDVTGLTARARSALERLGVHTIGELLAYEPSALTRAQGVPDATRKEILAQVRALQGQVTLPAPAPADDKPLAHGVEAVSATLLPKATTRNAKERGILEVLLGQAPTGDGAFLRWPAQAEAARATGQSQPQISVLLRKQAKVWLDNRALEQVRDEIVTLLDARGGVMSAEELADALMAARGSYTADPKRMPQAIGLARAAVEAELSRGGDARLAIQRFRGSDSVLVGREPDDPTATTTASELLAYAVRLGRRAAELAALDPLPTRQRALEELRTIPVPDGAAAIPEARLLQLAAAASNGVADVNTVGQLYPVDMPAERALRLAAPSLVGQTLGHERLQDRVRARFPRARPLPRRLDEDTLNSCGVPLVWDPARQVYTPRSAGGTFSATRAGTFVSAPLTGPRDDAEVDTRLAAALKSHGFLALLAPLKRLVPARRALLTRLHLAELDVTAVLLDELRRLNFGWEAVVAADTGDPTDVEFRTLVDLVKHHVVPEIEKALATDRPLLITEAAPLARYGQLRVLQELADLSRPRPAARLLLVPARRLEPAMLDTAQLPLTSPASQSLWLPETWITPTAERTANR
ncbi:BREX system serine/threonine kinase PglW [Dactylosporangium sp. NPDC048998]|uniref:BREX system serine/threonine kinase PglW n=1 Tax=Dactylosporangium sp. NPDC048998 TaxID=3363976 RepID=UPI0037153F55